MKPGRELNKLVAEAMGQADFAHPSFEWMEETFEDGDGYEGFYCCRCGAAEGDTGPCVKRYSTDWAAAGQAWEWLQAHIPEVWEQVYCCSVYLLVLGNYKGPAVMFIQDTDYTILPYEEYQDETEHRYNFYIPGESYPHAIALAVVEAARAK